MFSQKSAEKEKKKNDLLLTTSIRNDTVEVVYSTTIDLWSILLSSLLPDVPVRSFP